MSANVVNMRRYRQIISKLPIDEEGRKALNVAVTRKESSRDFTARDWDAMFARLSEMTGREARSAAPGDAARDDRDFASQRQINAIREIERKISWTAGLKKLVRAKLPPLRALNWCGELRDLRREEAATIVRILGRMADRQREQGDEREGNGNGNAVDGCGVDREGAAGDSADRRGDLDRRGGEAASVAGSVRPELPEAGR